MRNILKLAVISLVMIFLTGISCTKEKPLCEQNHFAHVTVHNSTSINLWVDATSAGDNYNHETRLAPGGSYKFTVDPGTVTVWGASDTGRANDSWNYDEVYVEQCDEYSYTWTNKKGAAEGEHSFIDLKDGGKSKAK